jgi:hypothetical protein
MQPYDFAQARDAAASASRAQADAERHLKDAYRDFAEKEERYRVSLAKEIVRRHAEDGVAWTVAPDLARGTPEVARLRRDRDISEGVREAMAQAAWRRAADRKDTQRFIGLEYAPGTGRGVRDRAGARVHVTDRRSPAIEECYEHVTGQPPAGVTA